MKRRSAFLTILLVTAMASACTRAPQPTKVSAPTVTPAATVLPAIALWGQPGVRLVDTKQPDRDPGYTYVPFTLRNVKIQPLSTPDGMVYLTQKEDEVYLVGLDSERGGYRALKSPLLLYRLPLHVSDQWQYRGPEGDTYTYGGIDSVETPRGERLAAKLQVSNKNGAVRTEWWVPGYGLVRIGSSKSDWTAVSEVQESPMPAPTVGQPALGVSVLLQDNGEDWFITDLQSEKELMRVHDNYWRSWFQWRREGDIEILSHTTFPGSWGIYVYNAYRLDRQSAKFVPLGWITHGANTSVLAGAGEWASDGAFTLEDFQSYPTRYYTFKFDGMNMRSDAHLERAEYASKPEDLLRRMTSPPPLSKEAFQSMFVNPTDAERAWDVLSQHGAGTGVQYENLTNSKDTYQLSFNGVPMGQVATAESNGQWKITGYRAPLSGNAAALDPLGELDKQLLGVWLQTMRQSEVTEVLGKGTDLNAEGTLRSYRDGTVIVEFVHQWDTVWRVTVTGSGKTPRGVGIGDTVADVVQQYGKPASVTDINITYSDDGRAGYFYLTFHVRDGRIDQIELRRSK